MPDRDGYTHGTPCWIDLSTDDFEGAKAFYERLFGWSWEDQEGPDGAVMYSHALLQGRIVAGLGPAPAAMVQGGVRSWWNTYLAVDSADDGYQAVLEAGGAGLFGPFDIPSYGRMAMIMDDQGVFVGLWQGGEHKGCQLVSEPGAFTWSDLCVPDLDAAARFYGAVLGLDTDTAHTGNAHYITWRAGEDIVGGLMAPPNDEVPASWNVYFGTKDAAQTAAAAVSSGGQIAAGPFPTEVGQIAVIHDPGGATFSVIQLNEWPS